jgi:hypothetical protein
MIQSFFCRVRGVDGLPHVSFAGRPRFAWAVSEPFSGIANWVGFGYTSGHALHEVRFSPRGG